MSTRREERIRGFAALEKDWDSYGADPIDPEAIKAALWISDCLPGAWHAFPTAASGVLFENEEFAIEITPLGDPNE